MKAYFALTLALISAYVLAEVSKYEKACGEKIVAYYPSGLSSSNFSALVRQCVSVSEYEERQRKKQTAAQELSDLNARTTLIFRLSDLAKSKIAEGVLKDEIEGCFDATKEPTKELLEAALTCVTAMQVRQKATERMSLPGSMSSDSRAGVKLKLGFISSERISKELGGLGPDVREKVNRYVKLLAQQYGYGIIVQEAVFTSRGIDITDYVIKAAKGVEFNGNELATRQSTGLRIGFVDSQRILDNTPDTLAAKKKLENEFKTRDAELQKQSRQGNGEQLKKLQKEFNDDLAVRQNEEMAEIYRREPVRNFVCEA